MSVLPLDQTTLAGIASAGRKAAAAGEMLRAGFPVPPGVCLSAAAFERALAPVAPEIDAALSRFDPSRAADRAPLHDALDSALAPLDVPAGLLDELWAAAAPLLFSGAGLAVRSSALDEDAADASRAGAYATVLGVCDKSGLRDAVLAVWRSFFGIGALAGRARPGPHGGGTSASASMAVLVQPLLAADCAGVCYSLDPVSPTSSSAVVTVAWGLGLGVVDGSVPADTLRVDRDTQQVIERRIVHKPYRMALSPSRMPSLAPTGEQERRAACLPDAWAVRIAQFALAAEALFGGPQDVEFAVAGDRVWILQSRPIASLPAHLKQASFPVAWENEDERRRVWHRSHPAGREHDLLLPLELDEKLAFYAMLGETCRFLGADMNRRLKIVAGRVYVAVAPPPFTPAEGRVRRQAWADLEDRLAEQGLTGWDFWGPEIVKATERLAAFDPTEADGPALAAHLDDAVVVMQRNNSFHPLASKLPPGKAFIRMVEEVAGVSGAAAAALAQQLVGSENSVVARILDEVYELARLAAPHPALAALVADPFGQLSSDSVDGPSAPTPSARDHFSATLSDPSCDFVDDPSAPTIRDRLSAIPGSAEFRARLECLLSVYGDRNGAGWGSEATVCTPAWRDRPEEVLRLAARFLSPSAVPPAEARRRAAAQRAAGVDALCASLPAESAARFRRLHARGCRLSDHLEEHNHYIDQLSVGQLRRAVRLAAGWLVDRRLLSARGDVFWLLFDEIRGALRAPGESDLAALVAARRQEYEAWAALPMLPLLGVPDPALPPRPPLVDETPAEASDEDSGQAEDVRMLVGEAASAGRSRGRARIILDPAGLPGLAPGDVLVAPNAGPLWTLYFPFLAGLVLDGGSVGQHPAAVAREFGIPAVVGARVATLRIPDGAEVLVDGTAGTVEII